MWVINDRGKPEAGIIGLFQKVPRDVLLTHIFGPLPVLELDALKMVHPWFARFMEANPCLYWGKWLEHKKRMERRQFNVSKWMRFIQKQYPRMWAEQHQRNHGCWGGHGKMTLTDTLIAKAGISIGPQGRRSTRTLD